MNRGQSLFQKGPIKGWLKWAGIIFWLLLVSVVPGRADVKAIGLGGIASIVKTKIAVPHNFEASIQETALNDQSLFAVNDRLIKSRGNFRSQIVIAKSGGGKRDLTWGEFSHGSAIVQGNKNSGERGAALLLFIRGDESIDGVKRSLSRPERHQAAVPTWRKSSTVRFGIWAVAAI